MDIHLRLEAGVAKTVRAISKLEDRTINKTINRLLRESLKDNPIFVRAAKTDDKRVK